MHSLFDLTGKVAIVTGASTGLGQAIAVALAGAGAAVVGVSRTSMAKTREQIEGAGGLFHSVIADIKGLAPLGNIVHQTVSVFGRIDILVNNAGVIRRADALDFSEEDWDMVMDTNLKSLFFLSQAVARQMIEAKRGGAALSILPRCCPIRAASGWRLIQRRKAALWALPNCWPANGRKGALMSTPLRPAIS